MTKSNSSSTGNNRTNNTQESDNLSEASAATSSKGKSSSKSSSSKINKSSSSVSCGKKRPTPSEPQKRKKRPLRQNVPSQRLLRCMNKIGGSELSTNRVFTDLQTTQIVHAALKKFKETMNFEILITNKDTKDLYRQFDATLCRLLKEAAKTCPTNAQKQTKLTRDSIINVTEFTKNENMKRCEAIRESLRENVSRVLTSSHN